MLWHSTHKRSIHYRPLVWGRYVFFIGVLLLCSAGATQQSASDIPPAFPLDRDQGRIYTVTNTVSIPWNQLTPPTRGASTPIAYPAIPYSNWNQIDLEDVFVRMINGTHIQSNQHGWNMAKPSSVPNQWKFNIPTPREINGGLVFTVRQTILAFSSKLDEQAALNIDWQRTWRDDIATFLEPSDFIESDHDRFKNGLQDALGPGKIKLSPHATAKTVIRYCIQNIESDGQYASSFSSTARGLKVNGALSAASTGKGSECDVVCACIAMLRAAGIPARPVIGITIADTVGTSEVPPQLMVWGEYALPNAGWVPFNTKRMRGTVNNLPLFEQWQGLGTLQWLNRRVPIAYEFVVDGVKHAYDAIGPWSWVPIYRNRPLPVPASLKAVPYYESPTKDVYVMIEYQPSQQTYEMTFVGSPGKTQ